MDGQMDELRELARQDLVPLQMENELLSYEVRHLRAQLAAADRRWSGQLKAREREVARLRKRITRLERARGDLVWLVRRLGTSPLGPVLRLRPGFRRLMRQYGSTA